MVMLVPMIVVVRMGMEMLVPMIVVAMGMVVIVAVNRARPWLRRRRTRRRRR